MNVGVMQAGSAANVVPKYVEVICDYRLTPGVHNEDIVQGIRTLLKEKSLENMKFELEISKILNSPAIISPTNDFGELLAIKTAKHTGTKPELSGMYYATDGAAFLENTPDAAFAIFGPGSTELLHQTNERLSIQELDIARKVILETLVEIA